MRLANKARLALSVLRYQLDHAPLPVAVAWLVTGRCEESCTYCRWKSLRNTEELDTQQALSMIAQMRAAGVRLVSFTGGEPLLRDDLGELIAAVKKAGMVCKLNTNGALVPERRTALRRLDLLQISLDGPASVQDRLRGQGSAQRAARAVEVAKELRIPCQLVACLTRDNVGRLEEVLVFARDLGVRVCVQPLAQASLTPAQKNASLPEREELLGALQYLLHLIHSRVPLASSIGTARSELRYYLRRETTGVRSCTCALVTATLLPNGKLIFCGNASEIAEHDALALGFAKAFSRLTLPHCEGCTCVGKLRLSQAFQLDPGVLLELARLR